MSYDATIIQEVLAGNRAAFGDLVRRYRGTVLRQVQAALKSPEEAEELTQDVFVHALECLGTLKRHDRFEAFEFMFVLPTNRISVRELGSIHENNGSFRILNID